MSEQLSSGPVKIARNKKVPARAKNAAPGRRGGRLTPKRYQDIMQQAAQLFIERGYEQVTIDDIVAKVGGSKRTLYDHFGGKAELFAAVIKAYCAREHRNLLAGVNSNSSLERQLAKIGTNFLTMILDKQTLEFHRLMVSMGRNFPSVGQVFFEAGPRTASAIVGDWISHHQAEGKLAPGNPERLASLFLDMLTGNYQLGLLTSSIAAATQNQIAETANLAAAIFLRGIGKAR
jgi:TetR/AcrR family transcriptional regulator, mexJK operon transcriptional repressor